MRFIHAVVSLIPSIAFAGYEQIDKGTALFAIGLAFATVISWTVAIKFCRAGGGWIIFGVISTLFVALPLTGYVLIGSFYLPGYTMLISIGIALYAMFQVGALP